MTRPAQLATAAATLAALGLPASAAAHSSVFTTIPKRVAAGSNPVQVVDDAKQYVAVNHGFSYVLRESNGVTTGGLLNFKVLPGAYRATIPKERWFAEGGTGAQPHATCAVPALTDEASVLAWQEADPFYTYVPFQRAAAGLDDEGLADGWTRLVKARTGVDLAGLGSPEAAEAACEALPGATSSSYAPADATVTTAAAFGSGLVAQAKAPLEAQVRTLEQAAVTTKAAADQALAAAEDRFARALASGPMGLAVPKGATLDDLCAAGLPVLGSGPGLRAVSLRVLTGAATAKRLGLRSRVLASGSATTAADGRLDSTLKAVGATAVKLTRAAGPLLVTVEVRAGDRRSSTRVTLARG